MLKRFLTGVYWLIRLRLHFLSRRGLSQKNIGLVVNRFDKGGLEQIVLYLYLGYKKRGWNAYILSESGHVGSMAERIDPADLFVFNSGRGAFLRFCMEKKINILHYHYNTFIMRGARRMGFKILYTMHNVYTWMGQDEIEAYSRVLSAAHRVIPVSGFVSRYYLARTGATAENVQTILNGVDFTELDDAGTGLSVTREALGFSGEDIVVAELASFHPVKHQIGMIGVMERLISDHPEIKWAFVGDEGDAAYFRAFNEALEASPAKTNIRVIPYFDHRYVGRFLREVADIFALPTLQEGCSNAVLEAIYCAKPLLLTDTGNAGDVQDSAACEVVSQAYQDILTLSQADVREISLHKDNCNTQELADTLLKIAAHPADYRARAVAAASQADRYGVDRMIEAYAAVIQALDK